MLNGTNAYTGSQICFPASILLGGSVKKPTVLKRAMVYRTDPQNIDPQNIIQIRPQLLELS